MAHLHSLLPLASAGLAALLITLPTADARACGGFFCGQQPVDQTAERILFEVGDGSVTMTTQISFNGKAEDFAWILPLSAVPDPDSLAEFPQQALDALDANSGPVFLPRASTRAACPRCPKSCRAVARSRSPSPT